MRRTYTTIPLAGLSLAALTLVGGCRRKTAEAADTGTPAVVVGTENVAVARQGSVTNGPALSGSLDASLDATVRAQVAGSIVSTSADIGQHVTKGQVLGRIDAAGLQDAFLSARSAVASAQSNYDVAQRNLQRSQTLLQAGAIAQRDLETAQTQATSARAALEDAKSRLATAQKNYQNTNITAPFTGIVSQKIVSAGDVVQPGGALFTVVDPSTMRLVASVPSDQLGMVRVGTDVVFTVTGYPGRQFHGTVTRVSPAVDPTTRQVQVIVSVPNPGQTLVAGLYADGRISARTHTGVVVPTSAVDLRLQRPAVVKVQGGKAQRVDVQLGMRDASSDAIEVIAGVQAGDTLLMGAAQGITTGTPVRVQAPPSDATVGQAGVGGAANTPASATPGTNAGQTNTSAANAGTTPASGTGSASSTSAPSGAASGSHNPGAR
jgi:RND family efflux transporter MFP subunit